ncbi:YybH family protein [Mesorhizobium cantuariense]|uniref:YybH family protein n=1 Tax=Mesorhizobium cantuariense TaxID=1300275 RepID=A0ABV7MHY0_9HYPH
MNEPSAGKPAYDPQQLEPMLTASQHGGDVDGMVALFEEDAVIDCGAGRFLRGHEAIRDYYAGIVASGRKFAVGEQRPAPVCGDLALTSTSLPGGDVTSEIARRRSDNSWLWVIDRYSVAWD